MKIQCGGSLTPSHYRYYEEKGFHTMLVSRVLNLFALMFTTVFSAFLLLVFKWHALNDPCIIADTCDISEACPVLGRALAFVHLPG
jgi:hypothetical protein